MSLIDTIADRIDDIAESLKKAAAELQAIKDDLGAHPQTDGSATDVLAAEIEAEKARTTATTVKVPVTRKDSTP
jgi:hypothetical protein